MIAYVIAGTARFDENPERPPAVVNTLTSRDGQPEEPGGLHGPESVVLFERDGDEIIVNTENDEAHFILITDNRSVNQLPGLARS